MSYSAQGRARDGQITEWSQTPQSGYGGDESMLDLALAQTVAVEIAKVVGEGGEVYLSVSGHSNPGRTPEGGWATDCMTVSVSRAADVVVPSPAPEPAPAPAPVAEPPVDAAPGEPVPVVPAPEVPVIDAAPEAPAPQPVVAEAADAGDHPAKS